MLRSWASALSSTGTSPAGEVVQSLIGVVPSISTRMPTLPPARASVPRPGARDKAIISAMPTLERVALGFRAHSGWAALVALGGPPTAPVVAARARLPLCDGSFPRQPYHAAENLPAAKARALVGRSLETAHASRARPLASAVRDRRAAGQDVAGAGLLLGAGRPLPGELPAILGSHPLIHTAEGEMYREALRSACEHAGVAVVGLREREIEASSRRALKLAPDALRARVAALGKPLGPPWTQDQKLASLAAWLVLTGAKN